MGKGIFIGIIAVISIVFILVVASMLGVIDLGFSFLPGGSEAEDSPNSINATGMWTNLELSDREHHQCLALLFNASPPFPQHQAFIQGLHMITYGGSGATAFEILEEYQEEYEDDGYVSYDSNIEHASGRTTLAEIWYNDVGMGKAIIVSDGSAIHNAFGYDVILTTSYGPILDYYDYIVFMETH